MLKVLRAAALLFAVAASAANAQSSGAPAYPERPVRILVPYAPGGITDIAARILGAKLGEVWGHQVVIENRSGGNGLIAMSAAVKADPDGYTLVMASGGDVSLNPALLEKMPYDVVRDLVPISSVSDAPIVLAATKNSPYRSVADVIAAAKAKPGGIDIGTPGVGSITHLVLEWLALSTATKFQNVPFKGGGPAVQALISGVVPLAILASSSVSPYLQDGSLRVLGIASAARSALNPDWPTLREQGVAEVDASNWTALFAPKGTPDAIIDKLNADVVKALNSPEVKARFASGGAQVIPSTPAELAARQQRELAIFKSVVAKSGMHVE
ncbi:MAG TPA: tripartite tricarboxylate transporter substrate binding protein [Bradyrhizobium sp.]|uniref:Bug family tripartite tricarboxylate transporter substrate binding protein n=1 Tax=Bradyrhizobium sp. TaxID=376 RepID=UPI002D7FFDBA|nr:tripartite tricarboxylate transporter substrate binding protein [Bradyrhizobium sp.]HET7888399.1 tripartite tricarboxylate transporter substrate binding protein [Bradyrhizobium sp.]